MEWPEIQILCIENLTIKRALTDRCLIANCLFDLDNSASGDAHGPTLD